MSLSTRASKALSFALADEVSANEVVAALNDGEAANQGLSTTNAVTFAGVTSTGDVKIANGHTLKVNNISVVGAQQTAVTPVAVTFTANTPATYGSPTGALTIADGTTPTVVELLKYIDEVRGNVVALQAVLHAHGLTT